VIMIAIRSWRNVTIIHHSNKPTCTALTAVDYNCAVVSFFDDNDDDDDDESESYVRPLLQLETVTSVLVIRSD